MVLIEIPQQPVERLNRAQKETLQKFEQAATQATSDELFWMHFALTVELEHRGKLVLHLKPDTMRPT